MRKNYYLAALALPLMFAACTQEDVFEGAYAPTQQGELKVSFEIEEGTSTRATWADNEMSFVKEDMFSLYWLGADEETDVDFSTPYAQTPVVEELVGNTNAVYAQEKEGVFTSKSLIFAGKNIAVFPADVAHVSVKDIDIAIDAEQTSKTIERIPYISNVLNIEKHFNNQDAQKPGYDVKVKMAVKQAANVFDMTLNLANHTNLVGAPFNLTVDKVVLKASANAFANTAKVVAIDEDPTDLGTLEWWQGGSKKTANSIVSQAQVYAAPTTQTLTSKAITKNNDGSYTVRFVVLPTEVTGLTNASKIEVHTNCGVVTLVSANATYVAPAEGQKDENGDVFTNAAGEKFAIAQWLETIVAYAENEDDPTFEGEKVGKVFGRSIVVDMTKADLSSIDVEDSDDILHYVSLYTNIGKKGNMTLNMVKNNFVMTSAAAKAVTDLHEAAKKQSPVAAITLNKSAAARVNLTTAGAIYDVPRLSASVVYVLGAGEWTMNDAVELANCSSIENDGTLTIAGTTNKSSVQNTLGINLTNDGTLKIAGNDKLYVASTLTNNGTVQIAAGQVLNFVSGSESSVLAGNVEVKGQLSTDVKGVQLNGVVDNYYIIGASATGGFKNNHTINVKENAIATYVADNTGSHDVYNGNAYVRTDPACIYLLNRTDEVVTDEGKEGKILYNWNDGNLFEKELADKFTYVVFKQSSLTIGDNVADVDIEFAAGANCKLISEDAAVDDVLINSGAALHILSGNVLTTGEFTNNGSLTLGGTIKVQGGQIYGNGQLITVSGGAIETAPVADPI